MNEQSQLEAIKAELAADGYKVEQDVVGGRLDLGDGNVARLDGLVLDLVAELQPQREAGPDRPRLLEVEIANRTRRVFNPRTGRLGLRRPSLDDDEAVRRFEAISSALAEREHIGFQIRFLDVSADQAEARRLTTTKVRNKTTMAELVIAHYAMLASSVHRPVLLRSLLIARLWSHWLRIAGHLHPGRERRELKTAHLRTLQKDLYDQLVLAMPPADYQHIHAGVLAIVEGGDVEPEALLKLEPEVRRLLDWAAAYYGVAQEKPSEPEPGTIFAELQREIRERAPEDRRRDLEAAVGVLRLTQGSEIFPREVARFQLQVGWQDIVSRNLMHALLEKASEL